MRDCEFFLTNEKYLMKSIGTWPCWLIVRAFKKMPFLVDLSDLWAVHCFPTAKDSYMSAQKSFLMPQGTSSFQHCLLLNPGLHSAMHRCRGSKRYTWRLDVFWKWVSLSCLKSMNHRFRWVELANSMCLYFSEKPQKFFSCKFHLHVLVRVLVRVLVHYAQK